MNNSIKSVLILVAVLMSTTGAEEVVYAQVGETVTLQSPRGGQYLYWFFGREDGLQLAWSNHLGGKQFAVDVWKNKLQLSDNSLIIRDIEDAHFGIFVCKVNPGPVITSYRLIKLTMTMNPPSLLLPGESVSLLCSTDDKGAKKPEIAWLNPQGKTTNSVKGTFKGEATGQFNGQWTCVVTNGGKEHRATVSVTVLDLSQAPPRPQYTSTFTPLLVPCSIPTYVSWDQIKDKGIQGVHWDFFPKPFSSPLSGGPQRLFSVSLEDLTWKKDQDRGLTPVSELKNGNLSLTRYRGKEADAGDYVCTLNFKNGVTLNRTVRVKVLQIISSPGTDLISGQQVNLTCSLGSLDPLPSDVQVKWFPPEQSHMFPLSSDHHPAHLSGEVGTGDGGKWRCELRQNSTWLTSAVITLKIEPRLNAWMQVIICSAIVIVILLTILIFIFYRRRQVQLNHSYSTVLDHTELLVW